MFDKLNLIRGTRMAVVVGSVAFAISMTVSSIAYSHFFSLAETNEVMLQYEINTYAINTLLPATAIGLVFAAAAFASHAPARSTSLTRSLLIVSICALISVVAVLSFAPIKSVHWLDFRYAMTPIITILTTAFTLAFRTVKSDSNYEKVPNQE